MLVRSSLGRSPWVLLSICVTAGVLVVCGGSREPDGPQEAQRQQNGAFVALINAGSGGTYVDSQGRPWDADRGFIGGSTVARGDIEIANTVDDEIHRQERYGMSGYSIPVAAGTYTVRLHFAETYSGITGAGQRVFHVNVEGTALQNLDVHAEAGGNNIALIKTFNGVNITDGALDISFTQVTQNPMINGIEVLPAAPLEITRRGHASTVSASTNVTAIPVSVPSGVRNGDLLVLVLGFREPLQTTDTSAITPSGWTLVGSHAGSQRYPLKSYVYKRVASNEPASYAVSLSDSARYLGAAILAFANSDTSVGVAQLGFASSGGYESSVTAPGVTTTADGALVVRVLQNADDTLDESFTPAGHTTWFTDEVADGWSHGFYFQTQTSAGAAGTASLVIDSGQFDLLNAITFTLNPASGTPPPPDRYGNGQGSASALYSWPTLAPGYRVIDLSQPEWKDDERTYIELNDDQDALIIGDRSAERDVIQTQINGGRNVIIHGGKWRPRAGADIHATIFPTNRRGVTFIEGVHIDNSRVDGGEGATQDAIAIQGEDGFPDARLVVVNSLFEGIRGHTEQEHGDGIQFLYTLGSLDGGIFIDGLSIETNYQGLFLPQTPGDTFAEVRFDSMDIGFTEPAAGDAGSHPWLLWFWRGNGISESHLHPVYFGSEVYIDDLSRFGRSTENHVMPHAQYGSPYASVRTQGSPYDTLTWPNVRKNGVRMVTGSVKIGRPAGGRLIDAARIGLNYPEPARP